MEVFVSGFSEETTKEQLKRLFGNYGHVIGARIIKYPSGTSEVYGFVKMRDITKGKLAVRKLNGSTFDNKQLVVQKWRRP